MSDFSFNNLNLSDVDFSASTNSVLQPGRHVCKVENAELKPTRTGGQQIVVSLSSTEGSGSIRHFINVYSPVSPDATRIGREQLKALLSHGGHANPDQPGDIDTIKGLVVGVGVNRDSYMKDGQEREGSKVSYYFDPAQASAPKAASPEGAKPKDDEIPF